MWDKFSQRVDDKYKDTQRLIDELIHENMLKSPKRWTNKKSKKLIWLSYAKINQRSFFLRFTFVGQ